jgi:hypothetical protein
MGDPGAFFLVPQYGHSYCERVHVESVVSMLRYFCDLGCAQWMY